MSILIDLQLLIIRSCSWVLYMLVKDWYDLSKHGGVRQLRRHDPAPSPYKPGPASPLRSLSSMQSDPLAIHPDPAHTYAIHGWGKDLAAGALLMLVHIRVFWAGSVEKSLDLAYDHFRDFCQATGKSTSIIRFDFKSLKTDKSLHGENILINYT